ncbi:urease accessory protein UreD [Roseivivax sp. CAU 1761]
MPWASDHVQLSSKPRDGRSVLDGLHQAGSLKALFPRSTGRSLQAVLVNTAGGITGGDRFALEAEAGAGTALTLTTQACERAYRALPGEIGQVRTRLRAGAGARLDWVPQETILFRGAALDRRLEVDLDPTARLLFCEPVIFGRAAMGERLDAGRFRDRVEIRRGGRPIYLDGLALEGDIAGRLACPATAGGAGAMAALVFAAPEAEAHLAAVRALLPATGGASLLAPDLLVLRLLAADGHLLRRSLMPILARLSGNPLPRPWMI